VTHAAKITHRVVISNVTDGVITRIWKSNYEKNY
jgi:hypothetical protein